MLTERGSSVLFHYTSTPAAKKILSSGNFELASVVGNRSEEKYAPEGYSYFLSLTRTVTGDYHRWVGTGAVLFKLDGDWFNSRYIVNPIDYWERSWLHSDGTRTREAEDRVFSKEATIPNNAITEVHVLLKEQHEFRSPETRQLMILSKQQKLPVYLYTDEQAWRLLDKRRATTPSAARSVLRGAPAHGGSSRKPTDYVKPWIELIEKNKREQLSDRAQRLLKNIMYYSRDDEDNNMGVDLSNARKPNAGDRASAVELIGYLQKNGYGNNTVKLKNDLVAKWNPIWAAAEKAKQDVAEAGAETSWSNDTDKITLQDILELTKDIKQINLPINDNLKSKLLHWDGNPEEMERVNQVTVSNQFPILIMVDEQGQIEWILDGNHRLHRAIQSQAKTIPAKLIKPSNLNDNAKKIFNIKEQGVAEGLLNFEEGDCPIFAIALHRLSKMPLMALVEYDEQMGSTVLIHAYVKLDDRWRIDFTGETDVNWMLQKYPNNGNAEEIEISEKDLLELGYGKSKCPTLQQVLPHAKEVLQNIEEGQQGVAEGSENNRISFQVQKGKNKFATTLSIGNNPVGVYQYDADTGRSIAEVYPEFKGKGLGKLLVLHAIYTAAQLGLDFQEDESRTSEYDNVLDSLSSHGYVVDDDGYWYVTGEGEQYLQQSMKQDVTEGLTESTLSDHEDELREFVKWTCDKLKIKEPPRIEFQDSKDSEPQTKTAHFDPTDKIIWIYTGNRNLADIMRSVAHELTHRKQDEKGQVNQEQNYPGSPIEQQADAVAGYLMKLYLDKKPGSLE